MECGATEGRGAQFTVGIDEYENGGARIYSRPEDAADIAAVIHLASNAGDTRKVANDDIVIRGGETIPGVSAYGHVVAALAGVER